MLYFINTNARVPTLHKTHAVAKYTGIISTCGVSGGAMMLASLLAMRDVGALVVMADTEGASKSEIAAVVRSAGMRVGGVQ